MKDVLLILVITHLQAKKAGNRKKLQRLRKKQKAKQAKNQTPESDGKSKAMKRNAAESEETTPKKSKTDQVTDFVLIYCYLIVNSNTLHIFNLV